jgi:hypothetical protein
MSWFIDGIMLLLGALLVLVDGACLMSWFIDGVVLRLGELLVGGV